MWRTKVLASLIFVFTSIAASAEEAQQLTCTGTMIEPTAMSQSPETVVLTIGPAQKIKLDLGKGVIDARKVSDNKIQLKFRTKDFEGEYFHYTGDLFFIYKSGHLMKLTCQKRENVGLSRSAD
jgi:hypothetical protein